VLFINDLKNCYLLDHYSQSSEKLSFKKVAKKLVADWPYKSVVEYRLWKFLLSKRTTKWIGSFLRIRYIKKYCIDIHPDAIIGEGLKFAHPFNIVIGAGVVIGNNACIYNGVTLGAKNRANLELNINSDSRYPIVGNNVTIFTGAKLLGPIVIGERCIIGANSVVMESVPDDSICVGIPGRVYNSSNYDN